MTRNNKNIKLLTFYLYFFLLPFTFFLYDVAFADNNTEFGVEDDLTVKGTGGTKADADVQVDGYSVFGSGAGAQKVISGAGSAYIQNSLELGGTVFVAGNVGIGTTITNSRLAIPGGMKVGQTYADTVGQAPLNGAIIEGNVGIATETPVGLLQVGTAPYPGLLVTSGGNAGIGITVPVSRLHVLGDGTTSVIITGGNVGIGTTAPVGVLQVGSSVASGQWLVVSPSGNVGVGTTAGSSKLQVAGGLSIATTSPSSSFLLRPSSDGGLLVEGNVGIGTTSPGEMVEVSGGNILQRATTPRVAGSINDITSLYYPRSVYVSGRYAYVTSNWGYRLTTVDISNPAAPQVTGNIYDTVNLNCPSSVSVSGKYAYLAAGTQSASRLTIIDISNPASPQFTGVINDATNFSSIYAENNIYVSGKYVYYAANQTNRLTVLDISNPASPQFAGTICDITNIQGPSSVCVNGKYAYLTAGGSSRLTVVDVSNPVSPQLAGVIRDVTNLNVLFSVYVSGKYAYVVTNGLTTIDISNPASPQVSGFISDATNLFSPRSVYVSGKYAYVAAGTSSLSRLTVINISNPASPQIAGTIYDATNLSGPRSVYVSGKYAYVASYYSNRLTVVDISGIDAPSANIGNIAANDISVSENIDIGNNAYIRSGLNVGPSGVHTDGVVSSSGSTGTNSFVGPVRIGVASGAQGAWLVASSSKLAIVSDTNVAFALRIADTSGADKLAIPSAGNLGIGTTQPVEAVDVAGRLRLSQAGGPGTPADKLYNVGGALYWAGADLTASASKWTLNGADAYRLAGNVGIGTSTPLAKLQIAGTASGTGLAVRISDSSGADRLVIQDNGNVGIGLTNPSVALEAAGTVKATNLEGSGAGLSGVVGTFSGLTVNKVPKASSSTTITDSLIVDDGSIVGIGGSVPGARLGVVGSGAATGLGLLVQNSAGAQSLAVLDNGNVGSGTTGPRGLFQVDVAVPVTVTALQVTVTGNVGIGTTAGRTALQVAGGVSIATTSPSSSFLLRPSSLGGLLVEGNVGIGTTSPGEMVEVSGGNILQQSRNPRVVGSIDDDTNFYCSVSVYVSGKYAYVANWDTSSGKKNFCVVDISNPALPVIAGAIDDDTNFYQARSVFVSGKYAYVANMLLTAGIRNFCVVDISNPASPVITGTINDYTNLYQSKSVYVSGKYAYVANMAQIAGIRNFCVVDISIPSSPQITGSVVDDTNLYNATSVYVNSSYAYVANLDNFGTGKKNFCVVDISNPASPVVTGGIDDDTNLYQSDSVYVSGKYAYVANGNFVPVSAKKEFCVVDISNPVSPMVTGGIDDDTNLFDVNFVYVSGKFAYVANYDSIAGRKNFCVVDISNFASPVIVGTINDDTNLYKSESVFVSGKYAYVANNDDGTFVGKKNFCIVDISGIDAPAANIGNIAASDISVSENIDVGNNAYVRTGLNVGPSGIHTDGTVSSSGTASTNSLAGNLVVGAPSLPGTVPSKISIFVPGSVSEKALRIIDTAGIDRLVVQGDGNVGIGTSAPVATIDVQGRVFLLSGGAPTPTTNRLYNVGGSLLWNGIDLSASDSKWSLGTGYNIYRLTGNVGIGTTAPAGALQITGAGTGTGLSLRISNSLGIDKLVVQDNGNLGIGTTAPSQKADVAGTAKAGYLVGDGTGLSGLTGFIGGLIPSTIPKASSATSLTNTVMTEVNSNVGVGISAAGGRLHIVAGTTAAGFTLRVGDSAGNDRLSILNNGNIGIGTTAPVALLDAGFLHITSGGNVGINTTAPVSRLKVAGFTSIASTSPSSSFVLRPSSLGGMLIEGNVGIATTLPGAKLEVGGGTILQRSANPRVAGSINDATNIDHPQSVYVSGKYAYVAATWYNRLTVVDISNPVTPVVVGAIRDDTNLNAATSVYISGKYVYVAASLGNRLTVVDISNPVSPLVVGSNNDATNLNSPQSVYVSGKYAYVGSGTGTMSRLNVIDISNPVSPLIVGLVNDATNLSYSRFVYVSGKYAYVAASWYNRLTVVDISNPVAPIVVGAIRDDINLNAATSVYVSGKYAYVTASLGNRLTVVDISNSVSPFIVGSNNDTTNLNAPKSVYVSGKYAYVGSGTGTMSRLNVIDISNPVSPLIVGLVNDGTNLNGAWSVYVSGKYAYVAAMNGNRLTVVDISGIDAPAANIGNIAANDITVSENLYVANNAYVRTGLNVGAIGIHTDGVIASGNPASANYFAANVGIGVTATQSRLDIRTSGTTTGIALKVIDTLAASRLEVLDNGNVGISAASPQEALDVGGRIRLSQAGAPGTTTDKLYNAAGALYWAGTNLSGNISKWTTGSGADIYRMAGNVGMGTTMPNARLQVAGTGVGFILRIDDTGPTTRVVVQEAGNVGIGLTNPGQKVEVSGTVKATSFEGDGSALTNISGTLSNLTPTYVVKATSSTTVANSLIFDTGVNIGVGTSAPIARLTTVGAGTTTQLSLLVQGSAGGNSLAVLDNGKVGIGTTVPSRLFQIDVAVPVTVTALQVTVTGNVGVGTTTASSKLQVAGGMSIATTAPGSTFLLKAAPYGGLLVEGNVGIGTTSPGEMVEVTGGNILQRATTPRYAGGISDITNLNNPICVYISGKYAYVANLNHNSACKGFAVVDIFNPVSPVYVGGISDITNLYNPTSVYVSGKYAYVANANTSATVKHFAVVDISNPASPIYAGGISDITNLYAPRSVYISGKYAFVANFNLLGATKQSFAVVDISNPASPIYAGGISDSNNLYQSHSVYVAGKYAYVANYNTSLSKQSFAVVDISNPASPIYVGGISDITNLNSPWSVYVSGKYAYVMNANGTQTINQFAVVDISNPLSPVYVGGISDITNFNNPNSVYVSGKYAYMANNNSTATLNQFAVVDISNPASPIYAGGINDITNLKSATSVYISGKYAYVANNNTTVGIQCFAVVDISGIDAPAANIGNIAANDITVSENIDIGNNAYVRTGLNVGPSGVHTDGTLSSSGTAGTNSLVGNLVVGAVTGTLPGTVPSKISIFVPGSVAEKALRIVDTAGSDKLVVQGDGNVGIASTSPAEALDMYGRIHLFQGSAPSSTADRLYNVGGALYWNNTNISASMTYWSVSSGSNIFRLTGNVGIGTSTLASTLTVAGAVGIGTTSVSSSFYTAAAPDGGLMVENQVGIGTTAFTGAGLCVMGGNMGVGTTAPQRTLQVADSGKQSFGVDSGTDYSSLYIGNVEVARLRNN